MRTMHGKGCKWCQALAGAYDYPDVPKDVYRRHERCRCTAEYDPGAGKRVQDVWSKRWTSPEERDKIEARIQAMPVIGTLSSRTPEQIVAAVTECEIADGKIRDYLLKPGTKHANDFFTVGYTREDAARLLLDIQRAFDHSTRVDIKEAKKSGDIRFSVYAMLGVSEKKRFCIGWQIDYGTDVARLITAFRKDGQ